MTRIRVARQSLELSSPLYPCPGFAIRAIHSWLREETARMAKPEHG